MEMSKCCWSCLNTNSMSEIRVFTSPISRFFMLTALFSCPRLLKCWTNNWNSGFPADNTLSRSSKIPFLFSIILFKVGPLSVFPGLLPARFQVTLWATEIKKISLVLRSWSTVWINMQKMSNGDYFDEKMRRGDRSKEARRISPPLKLLLKSPKLRGSTAPKSAHLHRGREQGAPTQTGLP